MRETKAASLPATCSASAQAQSFADETTTDLSISRSGNCSFSSR